MPYFQKLYAIEKSAREEKYCVEQRYEVGLEKYKTILNELYPWLEQALKHPHPEPKIGSGIYLYAASMETA